MHVALLYGGRSGEHDVSVLSARTVHAGLLALGHTVFLIAISLDGRWYLQKQTIKQPCISDIPLSIVPSEGIFSPKGKLPIEVAFATTHGYGGEDGNLQGLCLLANIPLCGCDTASSALGMHKMLASTLFAARGIPTVDSVILDRYQIQACESKVFQQTKKQLGSSLFIKPENSGSSLGVCVLQEANEKLFWDAVRKSSNYSERVLVQTLVNPMVEAECAILRDKDGSLIVAGPGRVIDPAHTAVGFLDYEHKYGMVDTAHLLLPSRLESEVEHKLRTWAKEAFLAIKADGYARVDFFVTENAIYLNEINTSPGMTATSHYPALMASIGYDMPKILACLLEDALIRAKEERERTYFPPTI